MAGVAATVATDLVLGRYRPLRPLGSGGSGSVWLARDEESGREVALKIVRREGKAASRAEREAKAAARLRHERCLRSRAFATDERHVYIAYDYVPGCTLREALRDGQLDEWETVEAAAQILEGLAHAHARGIVHRDVKPANVLLADDPGVSIRLLDFGLALFDEADTLTAAGDVPGTLAYISPERLRGREGGAPADVWAVGVLLWEALAGRHPFWASSPVETARKIEAGAPSLRSLRPDLPPLLVKAVDRALSRDPDRRPAAARLAAALRSASRQRRSERRPQPPLLGKWPSAESCLAAGLAALAAGWTTSTLAFYPPGWSWMIAAAASALTLFSARGGLAFTLAVPFFPLGNVASGLALLYAPLAAFWLALSWRDARRGLTFVAGPLLALGGALALLPVLVCGTPGWLRRGLHTLGAALAAAIVAGIHHEPLPLAGEEVAVALAGIESAPLAAERLAHAAAPSGLLVGAAALALAAVTLPIARRRGPWGSAVWAAVLLAALLVGSPAAAPAPTIAVVWAAWFVVAFEPTVAGLVRVLERLRTIVSARISAPGAPLRAPADTLAVRGLLGRLQPSGAVIRPRRD
jgi:eukaryotic-like serine/threonine-protein kinase